MRDRSNEVLEKKEPESKFAVLKHLFCQYIPIQFPMYTSVRFYCCVITFFYVVEIFIRCFLLVTGHGVITHTS